MPHVSGTTGRAVRVGLVAALLAAAALTLSLGSRPAHSAIGDCSPGADWGTARSDLASQVVDLVNQHRQSRGLSTLAVSPTLTNAAVWKARHMARYLYMQHNDPAPPV